MHSLYVQVKTFIHYAGASRYVIHFATKQVMIF